MIYVFANKIKEGIEGENQCSKGQISISHILFSTSNKARMGKDMKILSHSLRETKGLSRIFREEEIRRGVVILAEEAEGAVDSVEGFSRRVFSVCFVEKIKDTP